MPDNLFVNLGKFFLGVAAIGSGTIGGGAVAAAEASSGIYDRIRTASHQPEAVFSRLIAEHRQAWSKEFASAADRDAIEAVETLLADSLACVFEPDMLVGAAFNGRGMYYAAADAVVKKIGLDDPRQHSDTAHRYATELIANGIKAALDIGGLHEPFRHRFEVEQARQIALLHEKLDRPGVETDLPRDLLGNLAWRFEHDDPSATADEFRAFIEAKAIEWKALKARLADLEDSDVRLANARTAAEAAIARADFDEAENILAAAEEIQRERRTLVEVRQLAKIRLARADSHMLNGNVAGAASHFEEAASFLQPFEPDESAAIREDAGRRLIAYGYRFGGSAAQHAESLCRKNLGIWTRQNNQKKWGEMKLNIGAAQSIQAHGKPRETQIRLFKKAESSLMEAVIALNSSGAHFMWGRAQSNLGVCRRNLGGLIKGSLGYSYLLKARVACGQALKVKSPQIDVKDWSQTKSNLGGVLWSLALQSTPEMARRFLYEALLEYQDVRLVVRPDDQRDEWAVVHIASGNAYSQLALLSDPADRQNLINESIQDFIVAVNSLTGWDNRVLLAHAYLGLAGSYEKKGDLNGEKSYYESAIREARKALDMYIEMEKPDFVEDCESILRICEKKLRA